MKKLHGNTEYSIDILNKQLRKIDEDVCTLNELDKKLERELLNKCNEENKKRKVKKEWEKDWSPNFQRTLYFMATNESVISDPLERKALKTFIGKKSVEPFLAELNQFAHNPEYEPNEDNVIEIWNKLGKLIFKTILCKQNGNSK